ncbi:MAG: lipopolysaccharide heptosyltransferase II [Kiritimatiellia bacterium]
MNNPDLRMLIVVPNWLGDGVMAMPALQALREAVHPAAKLFTGARPGQQALWQMQSAVDEVLALPASTGKLPELVRHLKSFQFSHAVILPHSFRSALLPGLSGIPLRRGTVFQWGRGLWVNDPVDLSDLDEKHQQWEIAKLLLPTPLPENLPAPQLQPSPEARRQAAAWLQELPVPRLACIPGAARGPSKQWPGERFQQVAEAWIQETCGSVCWLGTAADIELCSALNQPLGSSGKSLAGQTDLQTFTALLAACDHALVNDSGGMHLAAAAGTPLTAVFGSTDPRKTGPLSSAARVIQHCDQRSRSIGRKSREGEAALARVTVQEVVEAVLAKLPSRT